MSKYSWMELLTVAQAAGSALGNTTTPTSILPTPAIYTLPAGFFDGTGKSLYIVMHGQVGNVVTSAPTFTFDVRLGSVSAFTATAQLSTTAHTALPWKAEIWLTCRAVGSGTSANLMGQMELVGQAFNLTAAADAGTGHPTILLPTTTPAVGTGFDSTAAQAVDIRGTWSAANASNTITLHQYHLFAVN